MLLVIVGGVAHGVLFNKNKKMGKKFPVNAMMQGEHTQPSTVTTRPKTFWQCRAANPITDSLSTGLCIIRVVTFSLRIAWACYPDSIRLGMAAQICVYAGVVILYIANLIFTQRIVRAQHPHFGWSKPVTALFPILIFTIVASILMLIAVTIQSFYTVNSNTNTHRIDRDIQLYGETWFSFISFLPIPIVLLSTLIRQHPRIKHQRTIDKFGQGPMRAKIAICLITAVVLCLGVSFRAGVAYLPPVLNVNANATPIVANPAPWYFSKACFYIFNFVIEDIVIYGFLLVRIDKHFYTPDGAKGPYSYAGGFTFAGEAGNEKRGSHHLGQRDSTRNLNGSVTTFATNDDRVSWGGTSRRSRSRSRVDGRTSWGGISREDIQLGVSEDGRMQVPYPAMSDEEEATPIDIAGVEQLMGYDVKTGKWRLRDVASMTTVGGLSSQPRVDAQEQV